MGVGELFVAVSELMALIKECEEIVYAIDEDYKDAQGFLQSLKEMVEGPLVDVLTDVVEGLGKVCSALIDCFGKFFGMLRKAIEDTEKTNKDGANLLKEALGM